MMPTTPSIGVPAYIYEQLREMAEKDHRSMSREVAWLVEQELKRRAASQPEGDWTLAGDGIPGRIER